MTTSSDVNWKPALSVLNQTETWLCQLVTKLLNGSFIRIMDFVTRSGMIVWFGFHFEFDSTLYTWLLGSLRRVYCPCRMFKLLSREAHSNSVDKDVSISFFFSVAML